MTTSKDLLQVLWNGADVLRGKMDANEYKTYLLGLVFYKYLSDSYLSKAYDLLMKCRKNWKRRRGHMKKHFPVMMQEIYWRS